MMSAGFVWNKTAGRRRRTTFVTRSSLKPAANMERFMSRHFVFYDTETTGTNTAFDQILQFGGARGQGVPDAAARRHALGERRPLIHPLKLFKGILSAARKSCFIKRSRLCEKPATVGELASGSP